MAAGEAGRVEGHDRTSKAQIKTEAEETTSRPEDRVVEVAEAATDWGTLDRNLRAIVSVPCFVNFGSLCPRRNHTNYL